MKPSRPNRLRLPVTIRKLARLVWNAFGLIGLGVTIVLLARLAVRGRAAAVAILNVQIELRRRSAS